jgi:hypothetical protein
MDFMETSSNKLIIKRQRSDNKRLLKQRLHCCYVYSIGCTSTKVHIYIYIALNYIQRICILVGKGKSLKIPKGQSESVYRRKTDNTMTKRKSTK